MNFVLNRADMDHLIRGGEIMLPTGDRMIMSDIGTPLVIGLAERFIEDERHRVQQAKPLNEDCRLPPGKPGFRFKFRYEVRGEHTWFSIYANPVGSETLALAGDAQCLRNEEFEQLKNQLQPLSEYEFINMKTETKLP